MFVKLVKLMGKTVIYSNCCPIVVFEQFSVPLTFCLTPQSALTSKYLHVLPNISWPTLKTPQWRFVRKFLSEIDCCSRHSSTFKTMQVSFFITGIRENHVLIQTGQVCSEAKLRSSGLLFVNRRQPYCIVRIWLPYCIVRIWLMYIVIPHLRIKFP